MALNFRHYNERTAFNSAVLSNSGKSNLSEALADQNNGVYDSISFIDDTREIYTHGKFYGPSSAQIWGQTFDGSSDITGDLTSNGTVYCLDVALTSDERLKEFTDDVEVDFDKLKTIPKKYYYWNDKSMGEDLQIGTSAQALAKVYPTCVNYDEVSDRYSVNYHKLAIVALAAIDKLYDEIAELKSKIHD